MTDTGRRVSLLRDAKVSLLKAREVARDRLCVGAKYPGKPVDYRYVASESCANIQKIRHVLGYERVSQNPRHPVQSSERAGR